MRARVRAGSADARLRSIGSAPEQQGTVGEAAASLAGDANGSGALRALREAVATTQGGLSVALRDCGITVDSLAPLMSSLQSSPPGSCPRWRLDLQGNALEDSALETILHAVADKCGRSRLLVRRRLTLIPGTPACRAVEGVWRPWTSAATRWAGRRGRRRHRFWRRATPFLSST